MDNYFNRLQVSVLVLLRVLIRYQSSYIMFQEEN